MFRLTIYLCSLFSFAALFTPTLSADSITLQNLQTIAAPFGGSATQVAINDQGEIAGTSFNSSFIDSGFVIPVHGSPVQINNPNAANTYVNGINNQGALAGYYFTQSFAEQGFTYSGGKYTPTNVGPYTYVQSINNNGDVTGYSSVAGDSATGFLVHGGVTTSFYVPGYQLATFATGVNDSDQVVGYLGGATNGFLRQSNGTFQLLDFQSLGINDGSIIVGDTSGNNDNSIGVIKIGASEYTFMFPGAIDTYIDGINNEGEVIGTYDDSNFVSHIFEGQLTATTPEPSTIGICGLLLSGFAVVCRPRK